MVHRRDLGNETLVFGNQGDLWQNAMTWYDHGSGSVWSQPLGEAILGPRKGDRLDLIPSNLTTWGSWTKDHPDTLALDAPGAQSGFRLEQMVVVVEIGDDAVGYPLEDVRLHGPVVDSVGEVPVIVAVHPDDISTWVVRDARVGDHVVELAWENGQLVDQTSGTSWSTSGGVGSGGSLEGQALNPLPALTAFPDDFCSFWPNGRTWEP